MAETKVIHVPGNAGNVVSEIDLAVGDVVEMSASGQVGHHTGQGANTLWNPDGTSTTRQEAVIAPSALFVFPDLATFSLIGRVGDGDPFVVGSQCSHSVKKSGRLCFQFNDHKNAHANNTGEYVVTVNITRSGEAVLDTCCGGALDRLKRAIHDMNAKQESPTKLPDFTVASVRVPGHRQAQTVDEDALSRGSLAGLCFKAPKGRKLTITEEGLNDGGGTLFYVPPGCTITWVDATFREELVEKGFLSKESDGVYTHTVRSRPEAAGAATTDEDAESWFRAQWLENWHGERWREFGTDQVAFRRTYSFTFQTDDAVLIFPRSSAPGTVSFTATLE